MGFGIVRIARYGLAVAMLGILQAVQLQVQVGKIVPRRREIRFLAAGFLKATFGFVELQLDALQRSKITQRFRKILFDPNRFSQVRNGVLATAQGA